MILWRTKRLTVYEHQSIKVGQNVAGVIFERKHLDALEAFYGAGLPYFSLAYNGVKFNEYVGVIHVGTLTIEVLPKADQANNVEKWRGVLLGMLKVAGVIDIHAPTSSSLKLEYNSILDLYLAIFISEVEALLHRGLVKKYRKKSSNLTMLKGCLQFSTHLKSNIVHKERFYVRHTVYDQDHVLNRILYKAINLIQRINTNPVLGSRIGALLLNFPEVQDCQISREQFDKMTIDRKTEPYRKAIGIAKLLLLNYHPDIVKGTENVLAIMFDMNLLWERFVYRSLQRFNRHGKTIEAQSTKDFWKPSLGAKVKIRPDIVINRNKPDCIVIDTKWKNLNGGNPSPDDLRQMYVYSVYYNACYAGLVYPGISNGNIQGNYFKIDGNQSEKSCGIITLRTEEHISNWQRAIASMILEVK